ncbi:hypothetical protein Baya_16092 [Bagarius yarrelli]|uniref:Uncharacterized protein n=1 Tax=Bagarius yarrelli TaxID=175774 RepID=A0A556VUC0_BAGYA|nr:hypothetical protein Baya_16092 [Bagarius yarrelli]
MKDPSSGGRERGGDHSPPQIHRTTYLQYHRPQIKYTYHRTTDHSITDDHSIYHRSTVPQIHISQYHRSTDHSTTDLSHRSTVSQIHRPTDLHQSPITVSTQYPQDHRYSTTDHSTQNPSNTDSHIQHITSQPTHSTTDQSYSITDHSIELTPQMSITPYHRSKPQITVSQTTDPSHQSTRYQRSHMTTDLQYHMVQIHSITDLQYTTDPQRSQIYHSTDLTGHTITQYQITPHSTQYRQTHITSTVSQIHRSDTDLHRQSDHTNEMSSVNVVLLSDPEKAKHKEILQKLYTDTKAQIFLFSEDETCKHEDSKGKFKIGLKDRNQSDVAKDHI